MGCGSWALIVLEYEYITSLANLVYQLTKRKSYDENIKLAYFLCIGIAGLTPASCGLSSMAATAFHQTRRLHSHSEDALGDDIAQERTIPK